jgi:hypothetical protein
LAMKHPWNHGKAKGSITEIFGALCAVPDMGVSAGGRRHAVFFDTGHGMCEMHESLPSNAESNGALAHPTRTPGYRAGTELGD